MLKKKTVDDYARELAKKYKLPKEKIRQILMYGMENIMTVIERGDEVEIKNFGHIRFKKEAYSNYLRTIKNAQKLKDYGKNDLSYRPIG